jgi:membrane protease YdiL (CAAX protease family)
VSAGICIARPIPGEPRPWVCGRRSVRGRFDGSNCGWWDRSIPPAWQGLLGSLYGPFDEEIVMRLFLLTVLSWLGSRIWKSGARRPSIAVLWTANILASVLFGLSHLPATAAAGLPIDTVVVSRAIVLNGLLGVGFGWLYFTDGLESAMLAHFSADIIIHVIAPLLAIV